MNEMSERVIRLRQMAVRFRASAFKRSWAMMEEEYHWLVDDFTNPGTDISAEEIAMALKELDHLLPSNLVTEEIRQEFEGSEWFFGMEAEVMAPRDVLRGFIVPVREVPTLPLTLKVFALLTIHGSKDLLDRHFDHGIHYHYALPNNLHTTTMICWDTRWFPDPKRPEVTRGLFHELHGLGTKPRRAKPELWGEEKRASIRAACEPDLRKWAISEFRCASNGAKPVWPKSSSLTPRSPMPSGSPRTRK